MKNSELIGVYASTDQVFDNGPDRRCVVGTIRLMNRECATVKGYAREDELERGVTYRFYGHIKNHPKYGPQFNFSSFVEESPVDEDSILAYLESHRHPDRGSVSRRVAVCLFEKFGLNAIDELIRDPVGAAEGIKQWTAEKASIAARVMGLNRGTQRCKLDLITLMNGRGFPKQTIDRCIKRWGAKASEVIRGNPFELVHLPGIGFRGADKLYCDLACQTSTTDQEYFQKLAAINRQGLCLQYAVQCESRSSGSTWILKPFALSRVTQQIGGTLVDPPAALQWAIMEGYLVEYAGHIAVSRMADHELDIAAAITSAEENHDWPAIDEIAAMAPDGKPLSDHQLEAIRLAVSNRIGALQGSPGVGKTFAVACIVKALIQQYGRDAVAVAAPTGKAGVRVAQSMKANGVDLEASTIHRLLGVDAEGKDGWSFVHNEQNPLPFKFIVLDESSMIDVDLLAALLRACTPTTHILFVGDSNQLAPVGHGRPFFDLQTCIPTGHLTEIRRNSGRIVQSCAEIRDRNSITFSPTLDLPTENLPLIEVAPEDAETVCEKIISLYLAAGLDVIEDMQFLTAKNDNSPVARKPLNKLLQATLNTHGEQVQGNPFRRGDKIVCLKNSTYPDAEEQLETHFVANGELGRVMDLKPGRMVIRLSDPVRSILVTHAPVQENEREVSDSEDAQRGAVGDWDLGYALSVHRSQGSQWKYVVVLADPSGGMVQTREWLYTAISRAELATFVVGNRQVVNQMLRRNGIKTRKTFLVERVNEMRPVVMSLELLWEGI